MPEQTYPVFYGTQRRTLAEVRTRFQPGCHPEVWRCVEALLVWGRGRWGIGGGGRKVQPDKPGFAPAGMSFHESQKFASGLSAYSAFDFVMTNPNGVHRAPTWAEARELDQFGLWAFITGEPWHGQRKMRAGGMQTRGWRTWVEAGRPDPDRWLLPVAPGVPPGLALAPLVAYAPPKDWWLFPLDANKPTLRNGSVDADVIGHVRYLQDAIWHGAGGDIHRDGQFGNETERRVIDVQHTFELKEDGIVGRATWGAIDFLVGLLRDTSWATPTPAPENTGVTAVSPCLYFVRPNDSPWRAGVAVYGSGPMGVELLPTTLFRAPNVHIAIPQVAGFATAVRSGEGPIALVKRLTKSSNTLSTLSTFHSWNGGSGRMLHPGDIVHTPV